MRRRWSFLSILVIILLLLLSLISGYYVCEFIFRLTIAPPSMIAFLIKALVSIVILLFCWAITFKLHKYLIHRNERFDTFHSKVLEDVIDAMNKIASGDFNVSVKMNEFDPFHEVADNVNRMAQELGSLEKLRQDFISDVSHEIQSPLTSIAGFAALLQNKNLDESQVLHYAEVIEAESKRLSKLAENLLRLSALESDNAILGKKEYRLDRQLQSILLMLEPQWAEKSIMIEADMAKVVIDANEDLLNQVFINLLHNAIKFTPEEGVISVRLIKESDGIICKILDTGIGILPEDQIHIFERFYKADKSRDRTLGGNGLGLSIVKKIVDLHGGTITIHSEIGVGTEFTITIPMIAT